MRSFLRHHKKQRSTRVSSQPITNNDTTNDTTTMDASSNSTSSTSSTSRASTNNGNGTGIGASILTLLAIQASDISEMVIYHNPRALLLLTNSNAYYHQSIIGTLGPCTYMILLQSSIYVGLAWKGERNQSRSRLEVCTAITTAVSASCKPECSSSAFAEEPTPPYPMMCSKQITFIMLLPVASRQLVMTYSYQHTNQ